MKTKPLLATVTTATVASAVLALGMAASSKDVCAAEPMSFAEDVLPIFKGRCIGCHQPGRQG